MWIWFLAPYSWLSHSNQVAFLTQPSYRPLECSSNLIHTLKNANIPEAKTVECP
jgi:hypothetical protein